MKIIIFTSTDGTLRFIEKTRTSNTVIYVLPNSWSDAFNQRQKIVASEYICSVLFKTNRCVFISTAVRPFDIRFTEDEIN